MKLIDNIPVVDTCVVIDMILSTRARHNAATRLVHHFWDIGMTFPFPLSALFEVQSALRQEGREVTWNQEDAIQPGPGVTRTPLPLALVSVDMDFFNYFFDPALPNVRAGDLIFLSMAAKYSAPLITEDNDLHKEATAAGLQTFRIDEYLEAISPS